jgi:hypothetical protein
MVVFDSRSASAHAWSLGSLRVYGAPRYHQSRFEVRELGEIDVVSRARAAPDLVTHDDARPGFPAGHLEGHTALSYGELAGALREPIG